jgi:hypothetical protein
VSQFILSLRQKNEDDRIRDALDEAARNQLLIEMAAAIVAVAVSADRKTSEEVAEKEVGDDAR